MVYRSYKSLLLSLTCCDTHEHVNIYMQVKLLAHLLLQDDWESHFDSKSAKKTSSCVGKSKLSIALGSTAKGSLG
jgi:hypothetical protein